MTDLMPIGEFARKSSLSQKALRLYEARGLLVPAWVDPQSGFRHYAPAQLPRARTVMLLRGLGMPLADIAGLLELGGREAGHAVEAYWRREEALHGARRSLVQHIRHLFAGEEHVMFEIRERDVPEQKVVAVQRNVAASGLPAMMDEQIPRLYAHVTASPARPVGACFVIYHGHVSEDVEGLVEVCVPLEGSVEPVEDIVVRMEPAHREAYATISRDQCVYPAILHAYDAVASWLTERGMVTTGAPREVYTADCRVVGGDDPVADVAYPFAAPAA